jgi:glycosyltransferase involved in cell wall biosynthesis
MEIIKMKKIGLYIPSMNGGGAEKVYFILANYFVNKGFQVDLLLTKKEGAYIKQLDEKINIIELSSKRVSLDIYGLRKYMKNSNPDVVMSAMTHCNIILSVSSFFMKCKIPIIVSEHSNFSGSLKEMKPIQRFIFKFIGGLIYRKQRYIVAVSEGAKQALCSELKLKEDFINVIYNPFEIRKIQKDSSAGVLHQWLEKSRKFKTLISVGRYTEAKDFFNLISAFEIVKKNIDARLIILGDGGLRLQLQSFITEKNMQNCIDLYGFVSNPFSYISKADLFVLSSKREGLSNVLIESMICGVPLVATDCPSGPKEILENGKWGKLVPVSDPEALSNAILLTLSEPNYFDYSDRVKVFDHRYIGDQYLEYMRQVSKSAY